MKIRKVPTLCCVERIYLGCVWILLILLKTKNNKKNIFQLLFINKNTMHMHCSCPTNSAIGAGKKKKKTKQKTNVGTFSSVSKPTLNFICGQGMGGTHNN